MSQPVPRRAVLAQLWTWTGRALLGLSGLLASRTLTGARRGRSDRLLPDDVVTRAAQAGGVVWEDLWITGPADAPRALSLACPHLGCRVAPAADGFVCPCHGSRFHPDGGLARGPAARPLERVTVERSAGRWRVRTRRDG